MKKEKVVNPWGVETKFFFELTQDRVLQALEKEGIDTTRHCLPYSCLENRVFEIGLESGEDCDDPSKKFVIAKFYRPGRWNKGQIAEEHEFLLDLAKHDIPAVAPIKFSDGETLKKIDDIDIYFGLFPKIGGRNLYEFSTDQLTMLGRLLARVHRVGKSKKATQRIHLNTSTYAHAALDCILSSSYIPEHLKSSYEQIVLKLIEKINPVLEGVKTQRIHGDCHLGNILCRNDLLYLVDFDDFVIGPPVQDFWLLFSGNDDQTKANLDVFLTAYESMNDFDRRTLSLFEPLRTLRLIHYQGWVAKRYRDPVFYQTFPEFEMESSWEGHIRDLNLQYQILHGHTF